MKKITWISFLLVLLVNGRAFSQSKNKALFDSTWYGFNTGSYPSGQSPSTIAAADFDNDGDSDLVVAQQNFSNGFAYLKNQKKGIYAAPVKYNSPAASKGIVAADFNNDSLPDVAITNTGQSYNGNSISVFLNKGKGKFGTPAKITVGAGPVGIVAADLDNDGDIDLAVANYGSSPGSISVVTNKGDGTFNPAINYAAGTKPYNITAAKIDADSKVDLVVANDLEKVNVLFNTSTGYTRSELSVPGSTSSGNTGFDAEAVDVDRDGDKDILYSSAFTFDETTTFIALFRNQGTGTFAPVEKIRLSGLGGGSIDLATGDLNGDGWLDIVTACTGSQGYEYLLNDKTGHFLTAELRPAGEVTTNITTADVNNDKKIDIITSDFNSLQVTVHRNFGKAVFPVAPTFITNNNVPGALDAADIDGDGDLDIVTSASGIAATGVTVEVQKNNGDGTFTVGSPTSKRGGGVEAKFRDLNGDDKPDLIFATAINSPPYDFHTAINLGNGNFGAVQTWSMNSCGWSDIDAFDVDNDGDLDAVILEWLGCFGDPNSGKRIFISKNNGNGTFGTPTIFAVNPGPNSLAGADFNKDGNIDLVTGQSLSLDVDLGKGNGTFQNPVTYALDKSPFDVIVNDFNGDGNLDIAACTEFNSEGMSVLIGNGNGTFKPAQNYDGAYSPDLRNESGITSGDVDGDGDMDIMVGNYASNDLSVYLNNGDGTFVFKNRYGVYYHTASPVFADFDGDGKGDIVAAVGLPPSFIGGAISIIHGTILNSQTDAKIEAEDHGQEIESNNLIILNNPFTDHIDIKFESIPGGKLYLILADLTGKQLRAVVESNPSETIVFNTGNLQLPAGIYLLTVKGDEIYYTSKVIKE